MKIWNPRLWKLQYRRESGPSWQFFLLIYIVKSNEQRDAKQEEREKNYQTVIENLTEKFQILNQVQNDLKEIKDNLLNKN